MDPKRLQRDLVRIEHRLGELDARRANTRDTAVEALGILQRPSNQEATNMAGGFFIGSDGKRREFDGTGRETTPGTDGAQTAPRLTRIPQDSPVSGPQGLTRTIPQPVTPAPGAPNTPADAINVVPSGAPALTRPAMSSASAPITLTRSSPQLGAPVDQQLATPLSRPVSAPIGAQTLSRAPAAPSAPGTFSRGGVSRDEAERRMQSALNQVRWDARTAGTTRSQRDVMAQAGMAEANYWAQAAGLEAPLARGEREKLAQTNAATMQKTAMDAQAQLQAEQLRQQGGIDRAAVEGAFTLRRPQKPVQLVDGSLAAPGPDGQMQQFTMPDGSPAFGAVQGEQLNQSALSRLVPSLTEQFLGADQYGMIPDPNAKGGRRLATAADRQTAFERATVAARETLAGGSAATPPQASSSAPAGSPPASLDEFLERAMEQNPDYSRAELETYFRQTYGAR